MHFIASIAAKIANRDTFKSDQFKSADTLFRPHGQSQEAAKVRQALLLNEPLNDYYLRSTVMSLMSAPVALKSVTPEWRWSELTQAWSSEYAGLPIAPTAEAGFTILPGNTVPTRVSLHMPEAWPEAHDIYIRVRYISPQECAVKIPAYDEVVCKCAVTEGVIQIEWPSFAFINFKVGIGATVWDVNAQFQIWAPWKRYPIEAALSAAEKVGVGTLLGQYNLAGLYYGSAGDFRLRMALIACVLIKDYDAHE